MFNFPKQRMNRRELMEMGFSRRELDAAYRSKGQRFARKLTPGKRNSQIIFDTDGLGKYFERMAKAEDDGRRLRL